MSVLRVLLVEDEPLNRALVRAVVSRAPNLDIALSEADTIGRARTLLASEAFDVVLLDVRLPDGSGLDLGRELRDRRTVDPARNALPLIAILSASVLPGDREDAARTGADAFVGKPFAPAELIRLLEEFGRVAARHGHPPDPADGAQVDAEPADAGSDR